MTSKAQHIELDNALVAPENYRVIRKCNMRINPGMKPKEPTYHVALDALALTTCYLAFLIISEVSVTVTKYKSSYRFKINNKKFYMNVEVFRDILNLCPRIHEIKYITIVIVDHLHQPWRTFASIINKCLCGKIDNIDSKKQDKMFYPRFTKIIIHHFLKKDKSISMRNIMFMHIARDDSLLALLDYVAYKTYYAIASGAKHPMSRKSHKKSDLAISFEESPSKKKSAKVKKVATAKPKPTKNKAPVKCDRGKGLNVLSEVALSEAAQLKESTKQSKKDFHISQAGGSGDGTDFESGVLDEQHLKTTGADEGTGTIPGVPDVPKYNSENENDNGDDDDDCDDNDNDDDNDGNDDNDGDGDDDDEANDDDNLEDDHTNDDDEETDKEDKFDDGEKIDDEEKIDKEEDDEINKELYKDMNVNLGNEDTNMTNADQGGSDQQNVSQESGFEQVEEDAHVTLTSVLDTQKADEHVQSSFVSCDFTSKILNLKNPSLADNEITSLMETSARHAMAVPEITSVFTSNIPPSPLFFDPLPQQATPTPTPTTSEAITIFPSLLDFSSIFKFNDRSTYEAAVALSKFEFTKILIDKMEKNKSYDKADYKRELYDAIVKSYQTDKDLFDTYEGRKEGSQAKKLSHPKIQGQRKRSLQAPLKMPPNLNISILASLPIQRSQVIQLMTQECNRIKSSTRGPKRQHFYGFAANISSSKDVYSRKRIIAVTRLMIMKKYDYGYLEEIEVRREDQKLYKFREGDFL
ncbi:hypothetical protein Tco_0505874 [Tanacetum coccineum]